MGLSLPKFFKNFPDMSKPQVDLSNVSQRFWSKLKFFPDVHLLYGSEPLSELSNLSKFGWFSTIKLTSMNFHASLEI